MTSLESPYLILYIKKFKQNLDAKVDEWKKKVVRAVHKCVDEWKSRLNTPQDNK